MQRRFRLIARSTGVALLAVVGLGGTGTPAGAFECPAPHPKASVGAFKEPEPEIVAYSNLLAAQGTGVVSEIVAELKKTHPGAHNADITNFLVTLYCPVVNRDGDLGDDQKRQKIMTFAADVSKELHRR